MVEVRGSCVGHFFHIWVASKTVMQKKKCLESKRVRYSQSFKFNYNTNRNLIILLLTQISKPAMETPEQCM